jgi:hypothetical protein
MAAILSRFRRSDNDPIVSPVLEEGIWKGLWEGHCVSVLNAKGLAIPVTASWAMHEGSRGAQIFDSRTEIPTPDKPAQLQRNETAWRVATIWRKGRDGVDYDTGVEFDYQALGYRKIEGNGFLINSSFLVESDQAEDIRVAYARIGEERRRSCNGMTILAVLIGSIFLAKMFGAHGERRPY